MVGYVQRLYLVDLLGLLCMGIHVEAAHIVVIVAHVEYAAERIAAGIRVDKRDILLVFLSHLLFSGCDGVSHVVPAPVAE